MSKNNRLQKRRNRLFGKSPYCFWCGRKLIHPNIVKRHQTNPPNMATIDHLKDRLDPDRKINSFDIPRTVLSCLECNNKRGQERVNNLSKEELWQRSGRKPKNERKFKMKTYWITTKTPDGTGQTGSTKLTLFEVLIRALECLRDGENIEIGYSGIEKDGKILNEP